MRSFSRRQLLGGLLAVVALGGAVASLALASHDSAPPTGATGPRHLLSLGDSLATGTQPGPDGSGHGTSSGYADVLAAQQHRALTVMGRGGATTASMLSDGQEAKAVAFLRAHRSDDVLVTIAIGANDVERCSRGGTFPPSCVSANVAAVRRNLPRIVRQLQAAAGPRTRLVGITYYDYFLAHWRDGSEGRAIARRAIPVERAMNDAISRAYGAAHVTVADVEDAFQTDVLTRTTTTVRFGTLPVAVARVCQWTWSCTPRGGRVDDHPNDAGYRVIARTIAAAERR